MPALWREGEGERGRGREGRGREGVCERGVRARGERERERAGVALARPLLLLSLRPIASLSLSSLFLLACPAPGAAA
jgi:hypothetical protein